MKQKTVFGQFKLLWKQLCEWQSAAAVAKGKKRLKIERLKIKGKRLIGKRKMESGKDDSRFEVKILFSLILGVYPVKYFVCKFFYPFNKLLFHGVNRWLILLGGRKK
ncbi:MAG: hypothetical protein KAW87_06330 [Candidatus Cloacimonetes bacterium]|nr:hypothetical protein [Candidatus Cloacimonadota bacterium]